jgi:hypothetical protein
MMRAFVVESILEHEDGSRTFYGTASDNGEPIVVTYAAGETVTRITPVNHG